MEDAKIDEGQFKQLIEYIESEAGRQTYAHLRAKFSVEEIASEVYTYLFEKRPWREWEYGQVRAFCRRHTRFAIYRLADKKLPSTLHSAVSDPAAPQSSLGKVTRRNLLEAARRQIEVLSTDTRTAVALRFPELVQNEEALDKLPDELRDVAAQKCDGCTVGQIAELTKLSVGMVRGRLARAAEMLRKLDEDGSRGAS